MNGRAFQSLPAVDPGFLPAAIWNRDYRGLVARDRSAREVGFALIRPDGSVARHHTRVLSAAHPAARESVIYLERLVKSLLWIQGGSTLLISGAPELAAAVAKEYSDGGAREFDWEFVGQDIYRAGGVRILSVGEAELPKQREKRMARGGGAGGCRIGLDLGGTARKSAALIEGEVIHSEEIVWTPAENPDPDYHLACIHDSITRAAKRLPRVDAIGISAAGVYVDNEVRVASLFRSVSPERHERKVRNLFSRLRERWGQIPVEIANDGDVAALAGAAQCGDGPLLGVSLGTSLAGGYVDAEGGLSPWLNELAFVPIDYRPDAPVDPWSGDRGCGERYLSRPGILRLARLARVHLSSDLPESLWIRLLQAKADEEERGAVLVFESLGAILAYALAHYAEFYTYRNLAVLGGAIAGSAAEIVLNKTRAVLRAEFPDLAEKIVLRTLDETGRRFGQAVAAASLPRLQMEVTP